MRAKNWLGVAAILLLLSSCGDGEDFPPGIPTLEIDVESKVLTWDSIAGAGSYNLYIKQVEDCPDIEAVDFQTPTKKDTKVAGVSSPFSVADYKGCTTCYYAALAAENDAGEGDLSQAEGWQIRNCP